MPIALFHQISSSSSYKVLGYQKSTDVCLSTMDGTPEPTLNAYMAVLIEKCQGQSIGKIVPLSYWLMASYGSGDVQIVRPQVGEVYFNS